MKLTETQLRQIIREELSKLNEFRNDTSDVGYYKTASGFANTALNLIYKATKELEDVPGVLRQVSGNSSSIKMTVMDAKKDLDKAKKTISKLLSMIDQK